MIRKKRTDILLEQTKQQYWEGNRIASNHSTVYSLPLTAANKHRQQQKEHNG